MTSSQSKQFHLDDVMPHIRETLAQGKPIAIGPKGTSMMPLIRQGIDYVELSPLPQRLKKYDIPLYQRSNGAYVLHRVVKVADAYTCIGDNQFVLETGVTHDQLIAVVSAIYRGEKRVPVTAFSYRVYCRFWHYSRPLRHLWLRGISWIKRKLKK